MRIFPTTLALLASVWSGNAPASPLDGLGSGFAMYKTRRLAEIQPYDPTNRVATHSVMRRLGQLSLGPIFNRSLGNFPTLLADDFSAVQFFDQDNDGSADWFVYMQGTEMTDLYGAFFALEEGGPPAWVVFPSGPSIDKNAEFFFIFNHWVDQNRDGRIDMIIYEALDLDGDGHMEADTAAYIFDDDFDGKIDGALRCLLDDCRSAVDENGRIVTAMPFVEQDASMQLGERLPASEFFDRLFEDLRANTWEGEQ